MLSANVRLFFFADDREELGDSPEQRIMWTLGNFAAEMERARTAQRTREALEGKARAGHSAGGRCYGYRLVPVYGVSAEGEQVRTHKDYAIDDEEAAVVRGMFEVYADGYGLSRIAKALNGDPKATEVTQRYFGGCTPPAPQGGTGSWCPSCARAMLRRPRYRGIVEYGATQRVRKGGSAGKRRRREPTYTGERPEWRIVPEELWARVQDRMKRVGAAYVRSRGGRLEARPETGRASRNLLSTLARCGCCGGNIVVVGDPRRGYLYYTCSWRAKRGETVCENGHRVPMAEIDGRVVDAIRREVLTPEAVDHVIDRAMEIVERRLREGPDRRRGLDAEAPRLRREVDNLVRLAAEGEAPRAVVEQLRQREARLDEIEATPRGVPASRALDDLSLRRYRRRAREQMDRFGELLAGDVAVARQALRKLLRDDKGEFSPIVFHPTTREGRNTFDFRGQMAAGVLFNKDGAEERT